MVTKKLYPFLILLSILFGLSLNASSASAQIDPDINIFPAVDPPRGFYYFAAKPNSKYMLNFKVKNMSNEDKSFWLYPSDVATKTRGGPAYLEYDVESSKVGSWFVESAMYLTLKAGEEKIYSFTLMVPEVSDGQYVSGILVYREDRNKTLSESDSVNLETKNTYSTAVQVIANIGKLEPHLELPDPEYGFKETGDFFMDVPMKNSGGVVLQPKGSLSLSDNKGTLLNTEDFSMESTYSGTTGIWDYTPNVVLSSGWYVLDYTVTYGTNSVSNSFRFFIDKKSSRAAESVLVERGIIDARSYFDWTAFIVFSGIVLLILLALFFLIFFLRKRKKKKKKRYIDPGSGTFPPRSGGMSM